MIEEIKKRCKDQGIQIGFSEDIGIFKKKKALGRFELENTLAVLPMEGNDSEESGAPSELTFRRYRRFAQGGAALIWVEAIAVQKAGRASPHQLYLDNQTQEAFAKLCAMIKREGLDKNGFEPVVIAQLTHSGRYSKPQGPPSPIIAARNPWLDEKYNIPKTLSPINDESLLELEKKFFNAALLAKQAGFDGIDIKMCHGYLLNELLSAFTRKGDFGGSYQGRTRFARDTVKNIREKTGEGFIIGSRMSLFDAMPYPYGFGMTQDGTVKSDLTEPVKLIMELSQLGLDVAAITIGNPYYKPHYNRPYDKGFYEPPEPALKGVERILTLTKNVKEQTKDVLIIGAGYTYLREAATEAGAYALQNNYADLIGFGRQAFAYPDFASDIVKNGCLDTKKVCITCSKCTEIMRKGGPTGCAIRDFKYREIYKEYCL
ncbi:MAG: NADH:flavin oxidoreductase [Christensenellales bacterium]